MKTVLVTLLTIGSLNVLAGGDVPPPCVSEESSEILLSEGIVLDRGNNEISYRMVMRGYRCHRSDKAKTVTTKTLVLHYDAPIQRSKNDGLLIGKASNTGVAESSLHEYFSTGLPDDFVAEKGLKLLVGGVIDDNNLPLSSIPRGFIGDRHTRIRVFGNAFPTHWIQGPFAK